MDRDKKVSYWTGNLYRHMRWAGENGREEFSVFDSALLEKLRAADPSIDTLMPSVLTTLSRMWLEDPAVFVARVNTSMGTTFSVDTKVANVQFNVASRPSPREQRRPWWKLW